MMIEEIIELSEKVVWSVDLWVRRLCFDKVKYLLFEKNQKLVWLFGKRWVWKTYLWLQLLQKYGGVYLLSHHKNVLKLWLFDTVYKIHKDFWYKLIFIDEIHRFPKWELEIKNIYDLIPNVQIIVSGSNYLAINKSKIDLSRRITIFYLWILSFYEFLLFKKFKINALNKKYLFDNPQVNNYISKLNKKLWGKIIDLFEEYLKFWQYPFFLNETIDTYTDKLLAIVDMIIYEDLPLIENLKTIEIQNIKRFLITLSNSPAFEVKMQKIIEWLDIDKNKYYNILNALEMWWIINVIYNYSEKWAKIWREFRKILFSDSNLRNAFWWIKNENIVWWSREDYFISSIKQLWYNYFWTKSVDFKLKINNTFYSFEIWWPSKKFKTTYKNEKNLYFIKSHIKYSTDNEIPLFLFWLIE